MTEKMNAVPEPWATAMVNVGAVNPNTGEASLNALARMAGTYASSLSRMIKGNYNDSPRPEIVAKVAIALDKAPSEIAKWIDINWKDNRPWHPPSGSELMDNRERAAVEEMIRIFVRNKSPHQQAD